ncbi:MAG: flippase [Gammaproteobacteria bacterium]
MTDSLITAVAPGTMPEKDVAALVKGLGTNLVGKLGGRALHVFAQILVARLLGPAGFGLYSIGWNISRTVGIIAPVGLDLGVIRFGAHYWKKDAQQLGRVVVASVRVSLISGGVVGLVFFLASSLLAELFGKPELMPIIRWFSFAFPLASGLQVAASATRITRKMRFGILSEELGQPLGNIALLAVVYLFGWGLIGAVGAGTASFLVGFVIAFWFLRELFFKRNLQIKTSKNLTLELLSYSLPTAFAGMFATLILFTDRILVGYFLPELDVGIYQAVSLSSVLFITILSAFKMVLSPFIADLHQKGEKQSLKNMFEVSTRWGLYLSLPIIVVIGFAPREIMTVLFGIEYEVGWVPLVILSIAHLINLGKGPADHFLIMTGHQKDWLYISAGMLLINVLLNGMLIPPFGIIGAALALLFTFCGIFVLSLVRVKRVLGISPFNGRYFKGITACLVSACAVYLIAKLDIGPSIISLGLKSVISFATFGLTYMIIGIDKEDYDVVNLIRRSFARG